MLSVAIFICLGWILSVCLHEFGHALVAYWGGDTSVKDKGYLTLNPLKYTDINLSLILPLIFLLMGGIALPGAAVYIDQRRLRNRWWQSAVSAAGPIASVIVTLLLAIPFRLGLVSSDNQSWILPALACLIFIQIYVILFNSLPIPPLDGYGVIEPWLPSNTQLQLRKFAAPGILFLFMLLWSVEPLHKFFAATAFSITHILGVPPEMIGIGFASFHKLSGVLLIAAIAIVGLVRRVMRKPHEVWFERGNTFSESGKYEQAIAAYDQAIQTQPNYAKAWHYRGLALFKLNRFEAAVDSYDKAIQIQPDAYEVLYNRGLALNYSKQYKAAVDSYDKAIQIKPDLDLAWHHQGMALYMLYRYEEALASYDKAIEINPNFAQVWNHRGCILLKLQRYEEAITSCEQAIKINPKDPAAWSDKGEALTKLQRYEEAINSCNQAIKLKSDHELAWLNRGIALEKMQQHEEAFKAYEKVLKNQQNNSAYALSLQGCALGKLKRYEEAIAACEKAIKIDPKYAFAWYNKACCYAEQNKVNLAIEALKQAIKLNTYTAKEDAKTDPSFDSIRNQELFKQLISE